MRHLLVAMLMLGLAGYAIALPQTGNMLDLSNKGIGGEPAYDGREGGETIDDAYAITAIPFSDTGATCDNVDDYDEVCPYSGSTSPDVVYVWACGADIAVNVDLCDSMYDTKVYVYDFDAGYGFGNPYACNDDAGCGYSGYQSLIEGMAAIAGHTYYIVVDGYGGSCGDYVLLVEENVPCQLECPAGGTPEGEPPLVDEYVDLYNGGCNQGPQYPFQYLCGDEDYALTLCCNAGNYSYQGQAYRDTDWFIIYKAAATCQVTAEAEYPTYIFQLGFDPVQRCLGTVTVDYSILLEPCTPATLVFDAAMGEEIWCWGGTAGWENYPEYLYILDFEGIDNASTASTETTWSAVKDMFK